MLLAILLMISAAQEMQSNPVAAAFRRPWFNTKPLQLQAVGNPKPLQLQIQPETTSRNCAIPLLQAQKDEKSTHSNMPVVKPQGGHEMAIVTPVPVCENFGK